MGGIRDFLVEQLIPEQLVTSISNLFGVCIATTYVLFSKYVKTSKHIFNQKTKQTDGKSTPNDLTNVTADRKSVVTLVSK